MFEVRDDDTRPKLEMKLWQLPELRLGSVANEVDKDEDRIVPGNRRDFEKKILKRPLR
jgi:hypothetical protein